MMRTSVVGLLVVASAAFGCNSSSGGADAGATLGNNANVPSACQMCLSQASGNDCATQAKNCEGDSVCTSLNKCVDQCANFTNCPSNCESSASSNATSEWVSWWTCACSDCAVQCGTTFCPTAANNDAGNDAGSCLADNIACTTSNQCCSAVCAGDNFCGCTQAGSPSQESDCSDCCSGNCDGQGNCL
jgi:hypothetical protein